MVDHQSRRPTSTKTRIETLKLYGALCGSLGVEDQHPLKQGLKPNQRRLYNGAWSSRRPTSTKTRIETTTLLNIFAFGCGRRPTSTKTRIET